jgi:hypothetical protein
MLRAIYVGINKFNVVIIFPCDSVNFFDDQKDFFCPISVLIISFIPFQNDY